MAPRWCPTGAATRGNVRPRSYLCRAREPPTRERDMSFPSLVFRRPAASTIISVVALVFAMGGFAAARIPGSGGVIKTCYLKNTGALRVIDSKKKCTKREKTLSLNQKGAKGDTGGQGPAGSDAQFNNATASGDRTGTYPNPT